jgi:hypothetical protein
MNSLHHPLSRNLLLALLCGLLGSAHAAMLADFNDPATWSDNWSFANWGYPTSRSTTNTYEGAGCLQAAFAPTEWNELNLNFASPQDWSNVNQLSVAAQTVIGTGTFLIRLTGTGLSYNTGDLAITNSWTDFTLDLSTLNRSAVTQVKLYWHGSWASSSTDPFRFDAIAVPEPAMAAMLGLGGLIFLRRRR